MMLSPHFSVLEMTRSATAARMGIDNTPEAEHIEAARFLANEVLEPIRKAARAPIGVNSWYRSAELNEAIGGVSNSQHTKGEAADLQCWSLPELAFWKQIVKLVPHLPIDQAIVYPLRAYFVHVSATTRRAPRRMLLVSTGPKTYVPWEEYSAPSAPQNEPRTEDA